MSVKLNSTGGGSVTLDSPSTASNYTVTLPSAAGTLATTTGTGSVFTNPTINGFTGDTSAITIGTTQFVKDASGNVGIGTASPSNKLVVSNGGAAGIELGPVNGDIFTYNRSTSAYTDMILTAANITLRSNGGSNTLKLDASGNLGLGVTPSAWASGLKAIQIGANSYGSAVDLNNGVSAWGSNYYNDGGNKFANAASRYALQMLQDTTNGNTSWRVSNAVGTAGNSITFTTPMTLDASGALSNVSYIKAGTYLWAAGDTSSGGIYLGSAGSGNARIGQSAYGSGTTTTYIGNAAITTSSDIRLKENIEDTKRSAVGIIKNLRVVDHTWNDPTDTCENNRNSRGVWMGLIAQEAINHIPWLVNKPLSDEDEAGNPQYWHMDYGYAVPLLVKAIQELSAQNNALEARLAQLEAK